jgi:hypothetical protein
MSDGRKNKLIRSVAPNALFEDASKVITSSLTCDQHDFLVWDTGTLSLKKPTLETDGEFMLGVARDALVSGQPKSPYQGTAVDASQKAPALGGPLYGVEVLAQAKTGDVFQPGALVYLDPATGGRGVAASGTKAIGVSIGPSVTAVAGQEIPIRVGARYPLDTLKLN